LCRLCAGGRSAAVVPIQGDARYRLAFKRWDGGSDALDYKVWAKTVKRRSRFNLSQPGIGGVQVVDQRVFVAANDALSVYDLAESGVSELASLNLGTAADVEVEGDFAYVAMGEQGLAVVDVSDAENPSLVGTATGVGYVRRLVKHGNRVYATAGQFGVLEFDVSVPTTPAWVDTLYVDDIADDVEFGVDKLIVTTLTGSVELYGLEGEQRHQKLATLPTSNWVKSTKVRGERLLALEPYGVVEEFDISSTLDAAKVGEFDADELAVTAVTDDELMTVLDDSTWFVDGVEVFDFEETAEE
jgi:hypothetical protein